MTIPISLLIAHFIGDFVLQSDWMATNKSKLWLALWWHTWVYSFVMFFGATAVLGLTPIVTAFWAITFITHFITDAVTSRITGRLWFVRVIEPCNGPGKKFYGSFDCGNRHWFFVMIGFDQLIHFTTLALTLRVLGV